MQFVTFESNFADTKILAEEKSETGISRQKIAFILEKARKVCALKAYEHAPINRTGIEAYAKKAGKTNSIPLIAQAVRATTLSKLEKEFASFVKLLQVEENKLQAEQKKSEYAVNYYLYLLFSQAFPQTISPQGKPSKGDVRLIANTAGWTVVKKAAIGTEIPAKEILGSLIGITETARLKEADFLCREDGAFSALCEQLLSKLSPRKSFGKLLQILEGTSEKELEKGLENIAENPSKENVLHLKELFYLEAFAQAGYSPYVPKELFNETYPELKIPKPRGNYGGKKKKK